ncbi:MAG TPA: alpha-hydroxy acid oxidase [Burkholderiales bacterium]|nr:alpha-hydroxy acid oxidase [Burkholderiales bacterium]
MKAAYNIEDLHQLARKRLPRVAYDYLERGAEDDVTMKDNRAVLERIKLRPRVLVDVSKRSQRVTLFGKEYDAPIGVAPTGIAGLYCFDADVALARAAAAANVPFVLSTASFVPLEHVAERAGGTKWFQLYMSKDRESAKRLVDRACAAGYEALVMTSDVPVIGNREFNLRNGWKIPFKLTGRNVVDGMLHPRWLVNVFLRTLADSGVPRFQNVDENVGGRIVSANLQSFRARRDAVDWTDVKWLRGIWPRQLFIKGILTAHDARRALEAGADGVFVSNHGGRQLDGTLTPIDELPQIADAVGGRMKIMVDSGFRRGSDIVKALALGADMAFVGRAPLYGASVGGEAGAKLALDILKSEVDRVMALIGCNSVDELDTRYLELPRND